jgi:hypothetical protein
MTKHSLKRKYCRNNMSKKILTIINTKIDLVQDTLNTLVKKSENEVSVSPPETYQSELANSKESELVIPPTASGIYEPKSPEGTPPPLSDVSSLTTSDVSTPEPETDVSEPETDVSTTTPVSDNDTYTTTTPVPENDASTTTTTPLPENDAFTTTTTAETSVPETSVPETSVSSDTSEQKKGGKRRTHKRRNNNKNKSNNRRR